MDERIAALAAANGWRYEAEGTPPALGTGLWEQVSGGVVRDKVTGDGWETGTLTGGERRASDVKQVGGFTVTTTVSVSAPVNSLRVGYLAMTLPRRLPHLVLDATSNGREVLQRPSRDRHGAHDRAHAGRPRVRLTPTDAARLGPSVPVAGGERPRPRPEREHGEDDLNEARGEVDTLER